jgi:L-amino acid N-acyltransferase YncA
MQIAELKDIHYPEVTRIYLEGISTGNATFQTEAPPWEEWDRSHLKHSRFVAINNSVPCAWAALSPVSSRCVYAGVAEVSVYVGNSFRGKGLGHLLLSELIKDSEANNIWTLQAGIFPENIASEKLHYKNGFRLVGVREKIGKMKDKWRDNLFLERRSAVTGK